MTKNDGGPAFPATFEHYGHIGMTIRDYFAAKAMAAMMNRYDPYDIHIVVTSHVAEVAYQAADAMLKEREK